MSNLISPSCCGIIGHFVSKLLWITRAHTSCSRRGCRKQICVDCMRLSWHGEVVGRGGRTPGGAVARVGAAGHTRPYGFKDFISINMLKIQITFKMYSLSCIGCFNHKVSSATQLICNQRTEPDTFLGTRGCSTCSCSTLCDTDGLLIRTLLSLRRNLALRFWNQTCNK